MNGHNRTALVLAAAACWACESVNEWTGEISVTIVSPAEREFVQGQVPVVVEVEPITGIAGVEFSIDPETLDLRYDTDIVAPWESVLDTLTLTDGAHDLSVLAVARTGETAEARQVILVDNLNPGIEVVSPGPRDVAFVEDGTFTFVVRARDGSGVQGVSMMVEGTELTGVTPGADDVYEATIDLTAYADQVGSSILHLDVTAVALDAYERESAAFASLPVARRIRWQQRLPSAIAGPVAVSPAGDVIYAATLDGVIYALDLRTGQIVCQSGPGPEAYRGPTVFPDGSAVLVGTASGVRAIRAAPACTDMWRARNGEVAQGAPFVHPRTAIVYFTTREGGLHAANAAGTVLWTRGDIGLVRSGPALVSDLDLLVVAADDNFLRAVALDASGNAAAGFRWTAETGGPLEAGAVVDGSRVYVGSTDFNVYAFNAADGTRIWDAPFATDRSITTDPFVDLRGDVYVTNRDARLFRLTPGRDLVWMYEAATEIDYSSPIVDERSDLVLFGEVGEAGPDGVSLGVLHAVDRESGEAAWTATLSGSISSSPTVHGGTVFIGTSAGNVYALFLDGDAALRAFEL